MRAVMFLSSMSARRRAGGLSPTGLLMRREDSWDGPARAASFMRQLHTRVGAPDRSLGLASSPRAPRAGLRRGGYPRARALAGVITESGGQKERQRSRNRGARPCGQPSTQYPTGIKRGSSFAQRSRRRCPNLQRGPRKREAARGHATLLRRTSRRTQDQDGRHAHG